MGDVNKVGGTFFTNTNLKSLEEVENDERFKWLFDLMKAKNKRKLIDSSFKDDSSYLKHFRIGLGIMFFIIGAALLGHLASTENVFSNFGNILKLVLGSGMLSFGIVMAFIGDW